MRNHAASAFSSMQVFYRWRKTQVVNYVITSRVKPLAQETNELILTLPGRHHHAIQYSPENGHWHIPIVDRLNTWLCLSLEKTPKFVPNSEHEADAGDYGQEFEWKGFEGEDHEEEGVDDHDHHHPREKKEEEVFDKEKI
jgi:hypothetical protein